MIEKTLPVSALTGRVFRVLGFCVIHIPTAPILRNASAKKEKKARGFTNNLLKSAYRTNFFSNFVNHYELSKKIEHDSFQNFWEDVKKMKDEDILENMSAELYKLNDIYRQKMKTYRFALWGFELFVASGFFMVVLFFLSVL